MGDFLTLGHEKMPILASIRLLALGLRRHSHMLAKPVVPVTFFHDDYEESNSEYDECCLEDQSLIVTS